jgi:uncharacterized membrane-anchored protein
MELRHHEIIEAGLRRFPEVTFGFWAIKTIATTFGEIGGHLLTRPANVVPAVASVLVALVLAFGARPGAQRCQVFFWTTIVMATSVGSALADTADESLGVGDFGASCQLAVLFVLALILWYRTGGITPIGSILSARERMFFWTTAMLAQTFGSALADWMVDSNAPGFGTALIGLGLSATAALYLATPLSRTAMFWIAFVLTGTLGAIAGDFASMSLGRLG